MSFWRLIEVIWRKQFVGSGRWIITKCKLFFILASFLCSLCCPSNTWSPFIKLIVFYFFSIGGPITISIFLINESLTHFPASILIWSCILILSLFHHRIQKVNSWSFYNFAALTLWNFFILTFLLLSTYLNVNMFTY